MTEYNNYILLSDHLTRERSGLQGYSQAASLIDMCRRQTAKSPCNHQASKRRRAQWFWRKRDAA